MKYLMLLAVLAVPAHAQSLWNLRQPPVSLISDTTARQVGDIITISIVESHVLRNNEKTEFEKESDLNAQLSNFNIFPRAFSTLPGVTGTAMREFESEAKYDKDGRLQTMMSALIIDVLPNGNMIVEGRRTVIMDKETKTMRITGIIRPYDVAPNNTIESSKIANASIAFEGHGAVSRNVNRGWLGEFLDYVWPF